MVRVNRHFINQSVTTKLATNRHTVANSTCFWLLLFIPDQPLLNGQPVGVIAPACCKFYRLPLANLTVTGWRWIAIWFPAKRSTFDGSGDYISGSCFLATYSCEQFAEHELWVLCWNTKDNCVRYRNRLIRSVLLFILWITYILRRYLHPDQGICNFL